MPAPDKQPSTDFIPWLAEGVHGSSKGVTGLQQDPTVTGWIEPALLNGFVAPPAPMTTVAYRLHTKTTALEFKGHIDATNAVTGNVAFYIIQPFWHPHDISFITDMDDGITFVPARVKIVAADGAVLIYW